VQNEVVRLEAVRLLPPLAAARSMPACCRLSSDACWLLNAGLAAGWWLLVAG
jgi:hypothetical protein